MRKLQKILIIMLLIIASSTYVFAQDAPLPPPPPSHGSTGNQPGGSSPISDGLYILLALGAVYGGKKLYDLHNEKIAETN